jgi:dolichyl-phosphate beta-glucosyltransferase
MISIVLPAFHASHTLLNQLPGFIEFMRTWGVAYELIIVDDGSHDREATRNIARQFDARFFYLPENKGKGAAVRLGVNKAKGDYIIFTDVDIPFEYQAFNEFFQYLSSGQADVAIGDRTLPQSSYFSEISRTRKLGSDIFSFIVGRFVTTGVYDTQCGMKAFTRKAAICLFNKARINGFAFDVELLFLARHNNLVIKQLPVVFRCNEGSSVKVIRHGIHMLFDLLRILFFYYSGRYELKN